MLVRTFDEVEVSRVSMQEVVAWFVFLGILITPWRLPLLAVLLQVVELRAFPLLPRDLNKKIILQTMRWVKGYNKTRFLSGTSERLSESILAILAMMTKRAVSSVIDIMTGLRMMTNCVKLRSLFSSSMNAVCNQHKNDVFSPMTSCCHSLTSARLLRFNCKWRNDGNMFVFSRSGTSGNSTWLNSHSLSTSMSKLEQDTHTVWWRHAIINYTWNLSTDCWRWEKERTLFQSERLLPSKLSEVSWSRRGLTDEMVVMLLKQMLSVRRLWNISQQRVTSSQS